MKAIVAVVMLTLSTGINAESLIPGIPNPNPVREPPHTHTVDDTRANLRAIFVHTAYCAPLSKSGRETMWVMNSLMGNSVSGIGEDPELIGEVRAMETGMKLFGKEETCGMYKGILEEKKLYGTFFKVPKVPPGYRGGNCNN